MEVAYFDSQVWCTCSPNSAALSSRACFSSSAGQILIDPLMQKSLPGGSPLGATRATLEVQLSSSRHSGFFPQQPSRNHCRRLSLLFLSEPTVSPPHLCRHSGIQVLSHTSLTATTAYLHDCSAGHLTNLRRDIHWKRRASPSCQHITSRIRRASCHQTPIDHRHAPPARAHASITTTSLSLMMPRDYHR